MVDPIKGSTEINLHDPSLSHTLQRILHWRELHWRESESSLSNAVGSLRKRTHPPLEQYITSTRTTQCPSVQTHTPHCMQEGQAYSKPVV